MERIVNKSSFKTVSDQFVVYGTYVNRYRHIPYVLDGLKPSYRRTILSAIDVAKDAMAKVATISGHCIGHYHPHGDASINPIVSELVNSNIFDGQGNHGAEVLYGESQLPAAPRYIEAKIADSFKKVILPVLKFIPKFKNDLGNDEYYYLPTPIPLGLTFGYLGIGVGTGCRIPAFTPQSILDAYLNDDPTLLQSRFGLNIDNQENLHYLWREGRGRIKFSMNVEMQDRAVTITGMKGPVKIDWSWFDKYRMEGRLIIDDLSEEVPRAEIRLADRVRYPSINEVYSKALEASSYAESYYIRTVYDGQVRDIGIYDWIDITYQNYVSLLEKLKKTRVAELQYDVAVFRNFRTVADKIINTKDSYEKIASDLKIGLDIVKTISSKSINTLRNSDPASKIPELLKAIEQVKNTDSHKVISDVVSTMQ